MKKILLIYFLLASNSFSDVVPCDYSDCIKKYSETLTRLTEAKNKNIVSR